MRRYEIFRENANVFRGANSYPRLLYFAHKFIRKKFTMATNVVMPKMGESITEGTILRWLKKEGDKVEKDEPIVEISTDKVDTEVPSPFAGTLAQIAAKEKETVAVGATLAFISGAALGKGDQPVAPTAKQ